MPIRNRIMGFTCCSKRVTKLHLAGVFLFLLVLYNEWLEYGLKAHNWLIQEEADEEYVRVLIAADPQILSEKSKLSYPLNIISTWDADRFISKTFHMALEKAHPEVVIFLGDLINDGSISNDKEFSESVQHFKNLMEIPEYVKKIIYVPGDNDIGGEINDPVTATKVKRFYEAFNQDIHTSYKFIDFVQVNAMDQHNSPNISMNVYPALGKRGRIRILLSHIPLLPISRKTFKEVIVSHEPSLIFSGHEHESFHFIGERKDALANEFWPLYAEGNMWVTENLSDHLHEITVPTCSYRMGKEKYGYGIAIIDITQEQRRLQETIRPTQGSSMATNTYHHYL
ncbi:metallophosphoesterase isoform X2 [Oratosquilla oratoria]|uniref:metallophosphoesterase isoform X2 n=1 Tax=Oratosquilla oratoria TaxID=337810 RepID=UPI003F762D65